MKRVCKILTFFEAGERDIWVLHIDLALEVHVREALNDVSLTPLGNRVVEGSDHELERRVCNVLFPLRLAQSVSLVHFLVRLAAGVEFADVPTDRTWST